MRRRSGKGSKSIFWTVRPAICGMEQSTIIRNPSSRFTSEGFPAQSAPPVRDGVLSRIQGHRQAGGCSRAFEHRNDAHLPCYEHGGASASARTAKTCIIKTEAIFCCAKTLKRIQLPLYSQLKRMQRSSCLRPRTLKWVQRHKLTVRFPPVNSIIYIWNHNFPCLCRKIVLYFATSKGSDKIVSLPLHIRNIDSVLKISYFGKTVERRRRKARWV